MHSIRKYPSGQLGDAMALADLREWLGEDRWKNFYEYCLAILSWKVVLRHADNDPRRVLLSYLPQAFDMFAGVSGRPVRAYIRAMWSILK